MEFLYLSLLISFLALDTTVAFQSLISSPLFASPLIGWLLGDVELGFQMGFLFQLLWLGKIPAGATIVPEGNLASMIGTALVILNQGTHFPNTAITLVFIESVFISYLGALVTVLYRKFNGHILDLAVSEVRKSHFKMILSLEAFSLFGYWLLFLLLTAATLSVSQQYLPSAIAGVGALFENQLIVVRPVIVGIGLAFVLPLLKESLGLSGRGEK